MHGALDETATTTFTVANPQSTAATITFATSPMSGAKGEAFHPALAFTPANLSLGAGEEAVVTVALPLSAGLFEAGGSYQATVDVAGSTPLELALRVTVDP